MNKSVKQMVFWTPRALSILFALFLTLFALDVFNEEASLWHSVVALLIHLVPVYLVLIALAIAWRREWIGALLFFGLAIFYLLWAWGRVHWSAFLAISCPALLIGALFLLNWKYRGQLRKRQER